MIKIWFIARKILLEYLREAQLLGLTLMLPLFFVLLAALGYGTSPKLATYKILVSDPQQVGAPLLKELRAARYADQRPVFTLIPFEGDGAALDEALKKKVAALAVFIEPRAGDVPAIRVRGDATNMTFILASSKLDETSSAVLKRWMGKEQKIETVLEPLSLNAPQNDFEAYTPGMMIFGVLMLLPQTATLIGRELRQGTLRRLRLTSMKTVELLAGVSLAQMVIAVGQVALMFVAALAFGFHNRGNMLLAAGICLVLSMGAVGMGLVMAAFSNSDSDALNTGSTISMIQVFLSGAFFPMPAPEVFRLGGYSIGVFDFLPATHAMTALQQVMVSGAGLDQVWFRVAATALLSILYFAASVLFFTRFKMKRV